jgi:hypothetical protein
MAETRRHRLLPFWLLLLALAAGSGAFAEVSATESHPPHSLAAEVNVMSHSVEPFVSNQWVVFTYRPAPSARYVALRFEHEGYAVLHPFQLNEKKIFVFVYQPPEGLDRLTYRISVDGMWMRDPANPVFSTDAFGAEYSHVSLEGLAPPPEREPVVESDGRVTFTFRGTPDRVVSVSGSFNLWDPFVHVMDEVAWGVYSITFRLPKGQYYYYFLENGKKRLDPFNPEIRHNVEGELVCSFQIP